MSTPTQGAGIGRPLEIVFRVDVMTVSLANEHAHWRVRQRRAKHERLQTRLTWIATCGVKGRPLYTGECARVVLTRHSRGRLDSDNLPVSMKSIRDEIAACLGIDDRSDRVEWLYRQASDGKGVEARITIWQAQPSLLEAQW